MVVNSQVAYSRSLATASFLMPTSGPGVILVYVPGKVTTEKAWLV